MSHRTGEGARSKVIIRIRMKLNEIEREGKKENERNEEKKHRCVFFGLQSNGLINSFVKYSANSINKSL